MIMEESQARKRRRIYAFKPDEGVYTWFLHEYVSYLVPALTKTLVTRRIVKENPDEETAEIVRFQVDMALVLSAKGFAWSCALKHKLETKMRRRTQKLTTPTHISTTKNVYIMHNECNYVEMLEQLSALPPLQRPFLLLGNPNPNSRKPKNAPFPKKSGRTERKRFRGEEEALGCRLRILRSLLPGGDVMEMGEMFSELQSYVVCLELQVSILGSLVHSQRV